MKTKIRFAALAVVAVGSFTSAPAAAHFTLQQPPDALQTDAYGDPLGGGTQKTNPCGDGTASGIVTQVRAGSMLHIKLTETIGHGGHYRVALVPKYAPTTTDLPEPAVTLAAGQCDTAAIESPVVAPVLADGLFVHTQAQATAGKVWETDVQLPDQTGDATLQVIEFMTPHAPQCFYHHCAQLKIVAADADGGAFDDGGVVVTDGGGGPVSSDAGAAVDGGGAIASADGGGATSGGADAGGAAPAGGTSGGSGCSVGPGANADAPVFGALGVGVAAFVVSRRRRRAARA